MDRNDSQNTVDFAEKLIGVISFFSIVLFLLKFTPLYLFVFPISSIFDILFSMLIFFRIKQYGFFAYFKSFQKIIDFLAAVPIIVLLARSSSIFHAVTPLSWFSFFRLLNIIPLIKRKSEFAKKHFYNICFLIIAVEITAVLIIHVFVRNVFNRTLIEKYTTEYESFQSSLEDLMENDENVILVYKNGIIQSRKGFIRDKKTHALICNSDSEYMVKINFSTENIVSDEKIIMPKNGIVVSSPEILSDFNLLMIMLYLLIFGTFVAVLWHDSLSKDGKKLAIIANSIKTEDYSSFLEELRLLENYKNAKKTQKDDELTNVYRMVEKLRQSVPIKTETAEIFEETSESLKIVDTINTPENILELDTFAFSEKDSKNTEKTIIENYSTDEECFGNVSVLNKPHIISFDELLNKDEFESVPAEKAKTTIRSGGLLVAALKKRAELI
ncbi:MAG: ion transporter [Treponema sp.]|nr:ion transporter [Treponema sp.]